jgi:hypothetical protein
VAIGPTGPVIVGSIVTPIAASGVVIIVALAWLLGLPGFTGAALNRQVVLTLLQLLAVDLSLLALLLLNLLLLLALDLTLLDLLLLDLLLLLAIDVANLLLLLALDLALLVLLLLNLLLLLAINVANLLLLLALLKLLLLRRIRLLATCAATNLVTRRLVTGQRVRRNAHTQQAEARQTPDTEFHAFLSEARRHEAKTSLLKRRSPHAISTLPLAHRIAGKEKGTSQGPPGECRPGSALLAPAHFMSSCGHMQPGGLVSPMGLEAAAGLIGRAAVDAMSGQ